MSPVEAPPFRVPDAAPLFAALGDETRLRVLVRLSSRGPASVAELCTKTQVTRQAIAKHLDVLVDAGLITSRRDGRKRICELRPKRLDEARAYLDTVSRQWDDALSRLKAFVEE